MGCVKFKVKKKFLYILKVLIVILGGLKFEDGNMNSNIAQCDYW